MPMGDRTGPTGEGPMTGRGMGSCAGDQEAGVCPSCGQPLEEPALPACPCGYKLRPGRGLGRGRGGPGRGPGPRPVLTQSKLNNAERMVVEAIGNLFKSGDDDVLGIVSKKDETSHFYEKQWNTIEEMFALKTVKSPFHEELTSAFRDIHSYKYVDDDTFPVALRKRLTARGIPTEEVENAVKYAQEICEDLKKDNFQEKEVGWNPNLAEITDLTRNAHNRKPSTEQPFTGGGPAPDRNEIA